MGHFKKMLESYGYEKARERFNVHAGMILGALAPIAFFRYGLMPYSSNNIGEELFKWGGSVLINFSTILVTPHIPIPLYGACIGAVVGERCAHRLVNQRVKRERESQLATI